jgi:hypothetical protein
MPNCAYCRSFFTSDHNLSLHYRNKASCSKHHRIAIRKLAQSIPIYDPQVPEQVPRSDEPAGGYEPQEYIEEEMAAEEPERASEPRVASPIPEDLPSDASPEHAAAEPSHEVDQHVDDPEDTSLEGPKEPPQHAPAIERLVRLHPNRPRTYGRGTTAFEARKARDDREGKTPYGPFRNAETFEVAEWILDSGVSQRATSKLLQTRMVRSSLHSKCYF